MTPSCGLRVLSRWLTAATLVVLGLTWPGTSVFAATADIQMIVCDNAICPWFKIKADPPPNWVEDSAYGDPRQMTVYGIPHKELPFIYVNASEAKAGSQVKENIETNQSDWLAEHSDSRFSLLETIGQFSVYEVRNPSVEQQPYEVMAFTQQPFTIKDRTYTLFIQAVLTGDKKADVVRHLKEFKSFVAHFND